MPYSLKINGIDRSDNVISIKEIPYTQRNPDYSLIFDYVDFELTSVNLPVINVDDTVLIYQDSTLLFNGKVDSVNYNDENSFYDVSARHVLSSLENIDVLDYTWDAEVYSREQTLNINTRDARVIQIQDVIEALLHRAGNYDIDRFYMEGSQSLGVRNTIDSAFAGDPLYFDNVSCSLDQMYFIREQMRCMGQDGIYSWDECLNHREDATKLSTLLNLVCSFADIVIYPKDETTFYITNNHTTGSFSVNQTYVKDEKKIERKNYGYSMRTFTAIPHDRNNPYIDIYFPANYNRKIYNEGEKNISNYQYLRPGDPDLVYGTVSPQTSVSTVNHFTPIKIDMVLSKPNPLLASADPYNCIYKPAIKEIYFNRIETTTQTEIKTTKRTYDENLINIEEGNRVSTIKTIVYTG